MGMGVFVMDYASFFGDLLDLALIWVWFFLGVFFAVQIAGVGLRPVRLSFFGAVFAVGVFTFVGAGVLGGVVGWMRAESLGVVPAMGGLGAMAVAGIWRLALQDYLTAICNESAPSIFLRRRRRVDESNDDEASDDAEGARYDA